MFLMNNDAIIPDQLQHTSVPMLALNPPGTIMYRSLKESAAHLQGRQQDNQL